MTAVAASKLSVSAPAHVAPIMAGEPNGYVRCGPGMEISNPRPADLVLIRSTNWLGKLIRFFERMRFRTPADRPFAYWSHAALVVTSAGHLVEVVHRGVVLRKIERYRNLEYHYVHLDLSESDRNKAVSFAYSCLREKYGLSGFLLLAAAVLLGDRFQVPDRGQQGCVALIVRALQRAGVTFERRPVDMTPGDLAKRFGVLP
jgi:hypothetical protein